MLIQTLKRCCIILSYDEIYQIVQYCIIWSRTVLFNDLLQSLISCCTGRWQKLLSFFQWRVMLLSSVLYYLRACCSGQWHTILSSSIAYCPVASSTVQWHRACPSAAVHHYHIPLPIMYTTIPFTHHASLLHPSLHQASCCTLHPHHTPITPIPFTLPYLTTRTSLPLHMIA